VINPTIFAIDIG